MKANKLFFGWFVMGMVILATINVQASIYSTAEDGGADVELRESQPTTARGTGTEIGARIADGSKNSVIFLKFNIADMTPEELANDIIIRTTYRNTNLTPNRFEHCCGGANTGFDYYVMNPQISGADWDEATLTPMNAPAYVFDGDFKTKPTGTPGVPTPGLTWLGTHLYDSADLVGTDPHLPVGGNFDMLINVGSELHDAIDKSRLKLHGTVTVAMVLEHEWHTGNPDWINFNYLFNPKEQTTLNNDPDSPYGGASNANGEFAPMLITTVPNDCPGDFDTDGDVDGSDLDEFVYMNEMFPGFLDLSIFAAEFGRTDCL